MNADSSATSLLKQQWQNPRDIFSLLLILDANVIRQCIARLTGISARIPGTKTRIWLTPAAFSFGWVSFAFFMLGNVFGSCKLLPEPAISAEIVNCRNGFTRRNASWVLDRLLKDHEHKIEAADRSHAPPVHSTGQVSLMVDIFVSKSNERPEAKKSAIWWLSWLVMIAQIVISAVPWILYDNWAIFLVTVAGSLLSLSSASLAQWSAEKWSTRRLRPKDNRLYAITRGNGSRYVMVIISDGGSWDLEALAAGRPVHRRETAPILLMTALLWVLLLLTATGIEDHTWFLIAVGGLGTLQNIAVSSVPASSEELWLELTPFDRRPTITGYQTTHDEKKHLAGAGGPWEKYNAEQARTEHDTVSPEPHVRDVMGALMELEKYDECQGAGAALLHTFFPGSVSYTSPGFHSNREREFWKYAATAKTPTSKAQ